MPPAASSGSITIREFDDFRQEVRQDFMALNRRLDGLKFVPVEVYAGDRSAADDRRKELVERIARLESTQQWLSRTLGVTLLSIAASVIVAAARAGAG